MARYKTLVSMHDDLMQSAQEGQEKIERAKARLARYMEEKDDEILQHNNELARLQMRFDRARSDVIIWVSSRLVRGLLGLLGERVRDGHTHTLVALMSLPHPLPRNLAGHTSRTPQPRRPSCLAPLRWQH